MNRHALSDGLVVIVCTSGRPISPHTPMPKAMSFTLYRVEADYITPGEFAFGCGWICDTRLQAEALLAELQDTRADLCDLRITPAHYGEPIA